MIFVEKPRERTFRGERTTHSMRLPADLYKYYLDVAEKSGIGIAEVIAEVLDKVATDWITQDSKGQEATKTVKHGGKNARS